MNGEAETGVTTMLMAEGLDTGDMLLKSAVKIGENETSAELFDRLSLIGGGLLIETLEKLEKGEAYIAQFTENTSAIKVRGKAKIYTKMGVVQVG